MAQAATNRRKWLSSVPMEYSFTLFGCNVRCDMRLLLWCVLLIAAGLALPLILTERTLNIYEELAASLMFNDPSRLLSASLRLIILNTIRSTPHYIGVLLIAFAISFTPKNAFLSIVKYVLSFLVLAGVYDLVRYIYGIQYVVKLPAIIVLLLAARIKGMNVRMSSKLIVISLLLVSVQGMDVAPGLEPLGFGHGEIAMDIKLAGRILKCDGILLMLSTVLFLSFTISAFLTYKLAQEKQQLQSALIARNSMEKMLIQARLKAAEMRSDREMQSLVHDLKSPLTTIQGLSSLTMTVTQDESIRQHQKRLSDAAERMSRMISEILYADKRELITVDAFIKRVLAHFSAHEGAQLVKTQVLCPDSVISVNAIRMIRVLINVLDNALNAISRQSGEVVLTAMEEGEKVLFLVRDNGKGIKPEELSKIWLPGYSGVVSTGLGLAFVMQVVEGHQGQVHIDSQEGEYTLVTIALSKAQGGTDEQ